MRSQKGEITNSIALAWRGEKRISKGGGGGGPSDLSPFPFVSNRKKKKKNSPGYLRPLFFSLLALSLSFSVSLSNLFSKANAITTPHLTGSSPSKVPVPFSSNCPEVSPAPRPFEQPDISCRPSLRRRKWGERKNQKTGTITPFQGNVPRERNFIASAANSP